MSNPESLISHIWSVSKEEAKQIQQNLSSKVILQDEFERLQKIIGVGVVFSKRGDEVVVAGAGFFFPDMKILQTAFEKQKVVFPYASGYFAFSAGPAILSALGKMERPDLVIFPGRGIAHPRGLGLASHLGVLLDLSTIACSKTPLWRDYPVPSSEKGEHVLIKGKNGVPIGAIVRTRGGVKPIFVTPGHKISVQTAVRVILACSAQYRIPEPLRQAHILAERMTKGG